jgi:hypothetical protein
MSTETFIYVPWQNQDGKGQDLCRAAQVEPDRVLNTKATIGEWRSWELRSDAEGNAVMVVTEQSAGWDDEEWNEAMRIKNGQPKS